MSFITQLVQAFKTLMKYIFAENEWCYRIKFSIYIHMDVDASLH